MHQFTKRDMKYSTLIIRNAEMFQEKYRKNNKKSLNKCINSLNGL
jgi:hypothetical protein